MNATNYYYGGRDTLISPPSLSEVIPKSGLVKTYVARAQRLTDAPAIYHVGAFLATLAAVVSPRARLLCVDKGNLRREEMLNLWVLLCGRPNNRKSFSVDLATGAPNVTGALEPFLKGRICCGAGSKEGYEELLIEQPNTFFAIREAPTFFAENRAVWMRNGSAYFCQLFDGGLDIKLRRHKEGEAVITKKTHKVCISMCAAGATTAVIAASKPTDWSGGLLSRMLILSAGRRPPRRQGYDWGTADLKIIRGGVEKILAQIEANPFVTMSKEAWAVFDAWDGPLQESMDGLPAGQEAVLSRLSRHVKVVATLYALSCGTAEVTAEHMRSATKLGQYSHQTVLGLTLPT